MREKPTHKKIKDHLENKKERVIFGDPMLKTPIDMADEPRSYSVSQPPKKTRNFQNCKNIQTNTVARRIEEEMTLNGNNPDSEEYLGYNWWEFCDWHSNYEEFTIGLEKARR